MTSNNYRPILKQIQHLAVFFLLMIFWFFVKVGDFTTKTFLFFLKKYFKLFKNVAEKTKNIGKRNPYLVLHLLRQLKKESSKKGKFKKSWSIQNLIKRNTLPSFDPLQNLDKNSYSVIDLFTKIKYHLRITKNVIGDFITSRLANRARYKQHMELLKQLERSKKPKVTITTKRPLFSPLFFFILIILSLLTVTGVAGYQITQSLPSPNKLSNSESPLTTTIYDRDGEILYRIYDDKNRYLVKLEDLPPYLVQATVSIEDKHFYNHRGVDPEGMFRAVMSFLKGEILQGGSTITQQLIKNTLLTPERTAERKFKEIILALWTETLFDKQSILTMYFNEVPYGGLAWGISAASQTYFGKDPKDLTLAESAYLAGLPVSPTVLSPYGPYPQLGKLRQQDVLRRMVEDGYITQEAAEIAYKEELNIAPPKNILKAAHFVMYVRTLLAEKYGEKALSQEGLNIYTTLDSDVQAMAEKVVAEEVDKLKSLNVSNGAAMVNDATNGQILAMVGSKDYYDVNNGNFNVTNAPRQPGSSIKPITYATAFKQGYTPGTILLDTPVSFRNPWEVYTPVNYDGKFHGAVSIRSALANSYNIPAVKTVSIVGIPNMIQTARDMGITSFTDPSRYGLSITLGGGEVKMVDMMTAYGVFATNGVRFDSNPILKITDSEGRIVEDHTSPTGQRALPAAVSYMISSILSDNAARTPAFGPNSLLNIPNYTVAVKTGTTDNKRDNWTFGYTPKYVVGVWVGNNDNTPMNQALTSGVTGAAPIFNKIMSGVLKDTKNIAFEKPSDINEAMVDGKKDLGIQGKSPRSIVGQIKRRENKDNQERETITFTDPFSTYTPDQKAPN